MSSQCSICRWCSGLALASISCGGQAELDQVDRQAEKLTAAAGCVESQTTGWANQALGAHAGAFTVVLMASPTASPTDALFGLSSGPAGTYADLAAIVRFNPEVSPYRDSIHRVPSSGRARFQRRVGIFR